MTTIARRPRRGRIARAGSEGLRIEGSRAVVYDALVDPAAQARWLGRPAVVEQASLTVYQPRVRLPIDAWPSPENVRPTVPYVKIRTLRPDGAEIELVFLLHAVPWATVVESRERVLHAPNLGRRLAQGWRAPHWRRRCLESLRREVEARSPGRLGLRRRRRQAPAPSHP